MTRKKQEQAINLRIMHPFLDFNPELAETEHASYDHRDIFVGQTTLGKNWYKSLGDGLAEWSGGRECSQKEITVKPRNGLGKLKLRDLVTLEDFGIDHLYKEPIKGGRIEPTSGTTQAFGDYRVINIQRNVSIEIGLPDNPRKVRGIAILLKPDHFHPRTNIRKANALHNANLRPYLSDVAFYALNEFALNRNNSLPGLIKRYAKALGVGNDGKKMLSELLYSQLGISTRDRYEEPVCTLSEKPKR